jgi:hypothetical protein
METASMGRMEAQVRALENGPFDPDFQASAGAPGCLPLRPVRRLGRRTRAGVNKCLLTGVSEVAPPAR